MKENINNIGDFFLLNYIRHRISVHREYGCPYFSDLLINETLLRPRGEKRREVSYEHPVRTAFLSLFLFMFLLSND